MMLNAYPLNPANSSPIMKKRKKLNLPLVEVVAISLIFHIVALLVFGSTVVWSIYSDKEPEFEPPPAAAVEPPPKVVRLNPQDMKQSSSKQRIAVKNVNLNLQDLDVPTLPNAGRVAFGNFGGGLGLGDMSGMNLPQFESLFGGSSGSGLEGTFYDLKQEKDGDPTGVDTGNDYYEVTQEFVRRRWSESVLKKFYAADKKLYASTFIIPTVSANSAPEAYGVADQVEPSRWIAHYKGTYVAPETGKYRFWGYADDMLFVRMDGDMVLDGSRADGKYSDWKTPEPELHKKHSIGNGTLGVGKWFTLRKGESVPMEVLLGERPGGQFGAYLLIEKKGEKYEMRGDRPILPIFTVGPISDEYLQALREKLGGEASLMVLEQPKEAAQRG